MPVIQSLLRVLANTNVLYEATHIAHWNITGPAFVGLHSLLNDQYETLIEHKDKIAERIRGLGQKISPQYQSLASISNIENGFDTIEWRSILLSLITAHKDMLQAIDQAITDATAENDQATLNILADFQSWHQDAIWRLASNL
jgi:starvation-inducible DNA-binding protein